MEKKMFPDCSACYTFIYMETFKAGLFFVCSYQRLLAQKHVKFVQFPPFN